MNASLARPDVSGVLPAAQTLADVVPYANGRDIILPPAFARAAVERLFKVFEATGDILYGPSINPPLADSEWGIRIAASRWPFGFRTGRVLRDDKGQIFVFPKHHVGLSSPSAKRLLQALEHVKPAERDAEGRIVPWVPVKHRVERLSETVHGDDDAVQTDGPIEIEELGQSDGLPSFIPTEEIQAAFRELAALAGFPPFALSVARGQENKHGFVTGRVWFGGNFIPRRMHVTTCPNADRAEIFATLAHELSHPLSRTREHGADFKDALISLAGKRWGEKWFAEARRKSDASFRVVDSWLASGIRAALRGSEPPASRSSDDGQLARVVTKIRKLRELAADQIGLPEAITASAAAADLITTYGLGDYSVRIDAGIDDQMVDRWMELEDDSVWRRDLAHSVARHFDVFSLHLSSPARMHIFGRYADVVGAEYLYSVSAAQIAREADRHIETWKRGRAHNHSGDTRREKTSFCESAAIAFGAKLERIAQDEANISGARAGKSPAIAESEDFAEHEHEKRGSGWSRTSGKARRYNAAGKQVGGSLGVGLGIGSGDGGRRMLPGKR